MTVEYKPIERENLAGVVKLSQAEGWPSFAADPKRAWAALTAPGVTTIIAIDGDEVIGFAQMQSDGSIQAHLSNLAVHRSYRRQGIGGRLIREAFARPGGQRVDLLSVAGAEPFYESFAHQRFPGYRIYPHLEPEQGDR